MFLKTMQIIAENNKYNQSVIIDGHTSVLCNKDFNLLVVIFSRLLK